MKTVNPNLPCPRCGGPRDRNNQVNCRECHNAYMRAFRPRHKELAPDEKARSIARAYLNVYIRRGKVLRGPCEVCGARPAEGHHPDHSLPLAVRWLCRLHHKALHVLMRGGATTDSGIEQLRPASRPATGAS